MRITNINTLTKTIQFYADPPGTQGAGAACAARFVGAEEFSWLIVESTVAGGSDLRTRRSSLLVRRAERDLHRYGRRCAAR